METTVTLGFNVSRDPEARQVECNLQSADTKHQQNADLLLQTQMQFPDLCGRQ